MKKSLLRTFTISALTLFILLPGPFFAWAVEFHDPPYDFFFGNHIDTHQETKLKVKGGNPVSLKGFFYIIFTGGVDPISGLPIAEHPNGSECEDENDGVECAVGWLIDAVPGEAKFLYHNGVNGNDHPVWMLNRVDIRQPGSFTHFHWITQSSADPRAGTVPPACDKNNAGQLETQAPSAVDEFCPGWFLQIRAVDSFAFEHGGEIIPVHPGIDNATHLNLVTNYEPNLVILPTR